MRLASFSYARLTGVVVLMISALIMGLVSSENSTVNNSIILETKNKAAELAAGLNL